MIKTDSFRSIKLCLSYSGYKQFFSIDQAATEHRDSAILFDNHSISIIQGEIFAIYRDSKYYCNPRK